MLSTPCLNVRKKFQTADTVALRFIIKDRLTCHNSVQVHAIFVSHTRRWQNVTSLKSKG